MLRSRFTLPFKELKFGTAFWLLFSPELPGEICVALLPWLPTPTPLGPRLQVGAWFTLWCWAGAPLLPALPWLGSLLSGCIGLANASHSTSAGSSQALRSQTCKRRGQRVSTGDRDTAHGQGTVPLPRSKAQARTREPSFLRL